MSLSLAELRASKKTSLPERTYSLCLAQGLIAEAQALQEERDGLMLTRGAGRMNTSPETATRLEEIDARLTALFEEMREATGILRLRATESGAWREWVVEHPAREVERDGKKVPHPIDADAGYGYVDIDALVNDLGTYAVSWNDEPLGPGEWEWTATQAANGDLREMCSLVVQMHEAVGSHAPKLLSGISSSPPSETTPN